MRPEANRSALIRVSLLARSFDADYFLDKTLADVKAEDLREDNLVVSEETLQAGGREVLFLKVVDADDNDEESAQDWHYYIKDSDGHAIELTIPYYVDEQESLHEAVMFMLANIEGDGREAANEFNQQLLDSRVAYNAEQDRWRVADTLVTDVEHVVQLPAGWAISAGNLLLPMAVKDGDADTSATAITHISSAYYDDDTPLAEILTTFTDNEVVQSSGMAESGGREIATAVVSDSDGSSETAYYLVKDSDGDAVLFAIQPNVPDKAALHDDVLFMAGNVESADVDYATRLARSGALPDMQAPDDGFELVSMN
jgi:hypothetical protein